MNEQHHGERRPEQAQAADHVTAPQHREEVEAEAEHVGGSDQDQQKPPRNWFAILSLVFDGTLVLVAILGGFFVYRQIQQIEEQLRLTRESNAASREALKETRRSNTLAAVALELSRSHGDNALELTRQSNDLTDEGLRFSRQALEVSERPWVTVADLTPKTLDVSEVSAPVTVTAVIVNNGRSPALNGRGRITTRISRARYDFTAPPNLDYQSVGVLGPGLRHNLLSKVGPISEANALAIKSDTAWLFLFGLYEYQDGFGKPHTLRFCFEHLPEDNIWAVCPVGNNSS